MKVKKNIRKILVLLFLIILTSGCNILKLHNDNNNKIKFVKQPTFEEFKDIKNIYGRWIVVGYKRLSYIKYLDKSKYKAVIIKDIYNYKPTAKIGTRDYMLQSYIGTEVLVKKDYIYLQYKKFNSVNTKSTLSILDLNDKTDDYFTFLNIKYLYREHKLLEIIYSIGTESINYSIFKDDGSFINIKEALEGYLILKKVENWDEKGNVI